MKTKLFYPLVATVLITVGFGFYQLQRTPDDFNCNANIIAISDTMTLDVNVVYSISANSATAHLQGTLHNNNTSSRLRRVVYMDSKLENSTLTLASEHVVLGVEDNTDTEVLRRILPHLYIDEGIKRQFIVNKVSDSGYIFTNGYVPSFYCKAF